MPVNNNRARNPLMGGLLALLLIGFASYRLYNYFALGEDVAVWRLAIYGIMIVYGLYVGVTLFMKNKDKL